MSFKKIIKWSLSSIVALSSVGCGEYLSGKKSEPEVIEFSDDKLACLKDLPHQLELFSLGQAVETDVSAGFDCMSEALRYFNKRTFGSKENAYTVEEMRRFFGKYFLKENNVSPEFAAELMKIKVAILGGSERYITKVEIDSIVDLLTVLKQELTALVPHLPLLLSNSEKKATEWETIHSATSRLRQSLHRLIDATEVSRSEYSFEDAKKAFAGLASFIKGEKTFEPYEQYSKWLPLVESGKNVLMGKRARFIDSQQWKDSLDTLIDLYEMGLKYHYSFGDFDLKTPTQVGLFARFLSQGISILENSHQLKNTGKIPVQDLDQLLNEFMPIIAPQISSHAMMKTYRAVLIRILDPMRMQDSRGLQGLEKKHLATLQRELNIWQHQQLFVNSLYAEQGSNWSRLQEAYKSFDAVAVAKGLTKEPFELQAIMDSWSDFGQTLLASNPLAFNEQGRLYMLSQGQRLKQSWSSLTRANLMRTLTRFLLMGYGEHTDRQFVGRASMSKAGLIQWYDDFQELGLELKAFDPRSANSGGRSFLEANFFTFSGDGNDRMSFSETYEFISLLFSAGLSSSADVSRDMVQAGCAINGVDVFGEKLLAENCFKAQLRRSFHLYFNNLPGMVQYVNTLTPEQWDEFYRYIYVAAVTIDQKAGVIETANIRTFVTILHYIEAVMVLYDTDFNQTLSLDEVYRASPRFISFFRDITGVSSETILKEGFAYLVFKGTIPTATDLAGFQFSKAWGVGEAQRMKIARLFGTLKDQLNKQ